MARWWAPIRAREAEKGLSCQALSLESRRVRHSSPKTCDTRFSEVWKERECNPSPNLVTEFALWVEKLGHYHDNFSTLVRMLRSVGKPIAIPYGINWLFEAFQRAEEPDRLFTTSRDLSALSQLLLDIWFGHGDLSSGDQTLFQRFTFLVDYLASKGEQIAVELQRKIQTQIP